MMSAIPILLHYIPNGYNSRNCFLVTNGFSDAGTASQEAPLPPYMSTGLLQNRHHHHHHYHDRKISEKEPMIQSNTSSHIYELEDSDLAWNFSVHEMSSSAPESS